MFGSFGTTLESLAASEFFHWFSLEPDAGGDGALRCFRPSGSSFHDLVELQAVTDGRDALRELRLRLARSFVDDPQNGAFALDITKSFLSSVLGAKPLAVVLEQRLAQRVDIRRTDVAHSGPALLSKEEDAALQVYAGLQMQSEMRFDERTLRLENEQGTDSLVISFC